MAEVGHIAVHLQDLLRLTAQPVLARQARLLRLIRRGGGAAAGVERLGQLVVEGGAALGAAAPHQGDSPPPGREQVDAWLGVEALILRRDQRRGKARRDRGPWVGHVVSLVLGPDQRGGVAGGRGDDQQAAERHDRQQDRGHDYSDRPEQQPAGPGPPAARRGRSARAPTGGSRTVSLRSLRSVSLRAVSLGAVSLGAVSLGAVSLGAVSAAWGCADDRAGAGDGVDDRHAADRKRQRNRRVTPVAALARWSPNRHSAAPESGPG